MTAPAPIVLLLVGELNFFGSQLMAELGRARYDPSFAFSGTREQLSAADIVTADLEGPLTFAPWSDASETKRWRFRHLPMFAKALAGAGIGVALLANNHIADAGPEGIEDTKKALAAAGVLWVPPPDTGPLELKVRGSMVALWNADLSSPPGQNPWAVTREDLAHLVADHPAAPGVTTLVFVHDHADDDAARVALGRRLREAGATWIIFDGPHVAGGVVRVGEGGVDLGLGNFVFGCECAPEREGRALRLSVSSRGTAVQQAKVRVGTAANGFVARLDAFEDVP